MTASQQKDLENSEKILRLSIELHNEIEKMYINWKFKKDARAINKEVD